MNAPDVLTPNLKLHKITADRRNWSEVNNRNYATIDAAIGAYFTINGLVGVWKNSTVYAVNQAVIDETSAVVYVCLIAHTSAGIPTTFAQDRTARPTLWDVYSSSARARGAWTSNTAYALNDFVVSGAVYAVCIQTHTSGSNFTTDLNAGKWSALIDLSSYGVMPTPTGNPNKISASNGLGTDYVLLSADEALNILTFTTFTKSLVTIGSAANFRSAIDAAQNGAFQASNANLTAISALVTTSYGLDFLVLAAASSARTYIGTPAEWRTYAGLGTAATKNTGTASGDIPLLGASGMPAVAASLLTALNPANISAGNLGATVIANLNSITNSLSGDVNCNNTGLYFDGPSVAQGSSGTWFASGTVTVGGAGLAAGDVFNIKLWDGTTVISSTEATYEGPNGSLSKSVSLSGMLATPAGNLRISVNSATRTNLILFNASGNSKDSTITAIRIA